MLLAAQKMHGGRKVQPAVMRSFVQSLGDALHRLDFDPFSGLQVYAPHRRCFVSATRVRAQKHSANSPEQPYTNSLCHFQEAAVASADIAKGFPKSLPSRQFVSRIQQFARLAKVGFRS